MFVIVLTTVFNVFSTCVLISLFTIITVFVMQIMNMLMSISIALSTCTHALYILLMCVPVFYISTDFT